MANFFTSDLHFGHANIIQFCDRPWDTVAEMNEGLVARWNAVVRHSDTVYVLGDFTMNMKDMETYTPRLNGLKVLIVGNHDKCFDMKEQQIARYISAGWSHVMDSCLASVGPQMVNLHHFPYSGDSSEYKERFLDRRLPDTGVVLLHGHVHGSWLTRKSPAGTLMVNVGVDVWNYCPVSETQIMALIEKGGRQ